MYIDTGERSYSGTGKNRQTTRHVAAFSSYRCIPLVLNPRNSPGKSIRLNASDSILAPYWSQFQAESEFKVQIENHNIADRVVTRAGDNLVGGVSRTKTGGSLVLLPMLDFYKESFSDDQDTFPDDEDDDWSAEGKAFAERLVANLLALDHALRETTEKTPLPEWASAETYSSFEERDLRSQLLVAEDEVSRAQSLKEEISVRLVEAGIGRELIHEKGVALESAIKRALEQLGFEASSYKDAHSEFDVVFHSSEGRLLGEAEGKDAKAINIDKLRQLSMNIHEDLLRDEVDSPAKAVLFGNGFRLMIPEERPTQFTEKCISAAVNSSTALVTTFELFIAARHASEGGGENYARTCREAILQQIGIVKFPVADLCQRTSDVVTDDAP